MIAVNEDLLSQLDFYNASTKSKSSEQISGKFLNEVHQMISSNSQLNVDLFDVGTVLKFTGKALVGIGNAKVPNRVIDAVSEALQMNIEQAKRVENSKIALMNVFSKSDIEMDELTEMTNYVVEKLGEDIELIFGHSQSKELGENVKVLILVSAE